LTHTVYIISLFHQSMVVIVRIEQMNKQTTRQINKHKLALTKCTEITFKRSGSLFSQITGLSKEK